MKIIFCFLTLLFFTPAPAWLTDFQQAKSQAVQSHKNILLNFSGSDWCIPCIRMQDNIFSSEAFIHYADSSLVLVKADFPRLKKNQLPAAQTKQNESLADQYNKHGSFPLTLLLSPEGKVIREWEGYPDLTPAQFVQDINSSIQHGK